MFLLTKAKVFCAAMILIFASLQTAHAGYDLGFVCVVDKIPTGSALLSRQIEIQVDEVFQRSRIRDDVTGEIGADWFQIRNTTFRGSKLFLVYSLKPSVERLARDRNTGPKRSRKVKYEVTLDRKSNMFVLVYYGLGSVEAHRVRVKGRCSPA